MKRWARIEAGVVRELFLDDPSGVHHPDIVAACVECNDDSIMDQATWDGNVFTNDPAKLAAIAARQQDENDKSAAKADAIVQYLMTHTPAECEAKVQNDVTDLASAKQMLKRFAIALCVLTKTLR